MKLGILKEQNDSRVAIVPTLLGKFKDLGLEICIEQNAGVKASCADEEYTANATVCSRKEVLQNSDIVVCINAPSDEDLALLRPETLVISQFQSFIDDKVAPKLKGMNLRAFGMDVIPRTTLAQSMDVLSSMASIAGYKAVLDAASRLPRYLPMMITAAGSIKPAKVLILGAGVAGLQAIATARRLGATVEVFDTRAAVKEEVQSLGARFVEVAGAKDESSAGGYAVEQSEEFLQRQRAEVADRASKADIVITTAQVRGRKAPILLTQETVEKMKRGSVVVDLAASTGGNCELTQDRQVIVHNGVTIVGNSDLASEMPQDASFLYGNNLLNFMKLFVKKGELNIDLQNEIIRGAYLTA
ncbi:MAG: Re/Si-specific NAD(P)(+) transhydrogenase subunit alpha [Saprospiraceae bacterium]|jgi:NAD(P) transhydrogenase subunit alpha|nr:Re/Si-specific NAD(P)(+) transhydrogenase subunit alpha [Saprospiraceae bacterium]HRD81524.1 Re/Si-specific NAD(P)(+) transhydrogenase subunit alpha [Saprospiraceae bacterium]HRJ16293.1 Re/Si-specific NAD(P)(+) transhydrogenase subunit alpha [Saprospiraceae bacterium]